MASRWADKRISNCPDNGKAPGWLASGLGVYQDYQKYSGGDFVIAAGADITGPIIGGVAGSVEGDKVAADIKDKYAVTDEEKHANKN